MPWIFTYSDLSPQSVTSVLENAPFCSLPASLPNHKVSFKGRSRKWGGAIATIERAKGSWVYGSALLLPPEDIRIIDKYYSGYEVKEMTLLLNATQDKIKARTYVLDKSLPYGQPSEEYTKAMLKHLKFFWGQAGAGKITLEKFHISTEPPKRSKRKEAEAQQTKQAETQQAEPAKEDTAPKKRRRRKSIKKK